MRSRPLKRTGGFTPAQLAQQAKFAVVIGFESTMTSLLEVSFKNYAVQKSGYNSAVSYNLKNAVAGNYPDYTIDYSLALISRRDLPNAGAPAATVTGQKVFFNWTDNSGMGKAQATDTAILVVYCEALKMTVYNISGGDRSSASANIDVSSFKANTIETWLSFISADGKEVANSFYTGHLTVS